MPPKKKRTGLIVALVAVAVLVVCGGGGFGGWYVFLDGEHTVDEWFEDEPSYPQTYSPEVDPVAPGRTYPQLTFGGAGWLCDEIDTLRLSAVLPSDDSRHDEDDYDDSKLFRCTVTQSNRDEHPEYGADGEWELKIQQFDDPARAAQDYATNKKSVFGSKPPLSTEGLELEAGAYDLSNPGTPSIKEIAVQAVDGNLLIIARWKVTGAHLRTPGVPVEVLAALSVDMVNATVAGLA